MEDVIGRLRLNNILEPKQIDIELLDNMGTLSGIYEIEDNFLKIAWVHQDLSGNPARPISWDNLNTERIILNATTELEGTSNTFKRQI
jgi:hypothetical protein